MAVVKTPLGSTLRLIVETGTDLEGKPILRNRNYSNVKPTAADQDLFDVGTLLVSLQQNSLNAMQRLDDAALDDDQT
jgi:hypothetical protein